MLKNDIELFVEKFSENLPRSLERIYSLLDRIDNPQNSIKNVIHIAGTNGKGSVLSYIKSCLLMDKQKVNAFTSPHLIKITERILIDNKSAFYLTGSDLYYKDSDFDAALKFKNPNAQRQCGCGESFAI